MMPIQPQPQAAPQVPQGPISPQQPTPQAPQPEQMQGQPDMQGQPPSGRAGQPYNPAIIDGLDQHLKALPLPQKQYLAHYLTPELAVLFGMVMGQESFDYFKKFADPTKTLLVQAKSGAGGQETSPSSDVGGSREPVQPQQAKPPARSVMGR